eukprot:1868510-Amphidinium_carterae.2
MSWRSQHWGFQGELDLPDSHPLLAGHTGAQVCGNILSQKLCPTTLLSGCSEALGPAGPHGWLALRTPFGFENVS